MNQPIPPPDFEYDPHAAIGGFVRSLVVRERLLLVGRVLAQALGLALGLALLATVAAAFRWDRSLSAGILVVVGGVGLFGLVGAPLMIGWRRTGDVLRQARLVERLRPRLEGRFLTSVERVDGPQGQESAAVVHLIARRAWERLGSLTPGGVHTALPLILSAAVVVVVLMVTLVSSLVAPGGPVGIWRYWSASDAALADAEIEEKGSADHARVGDLVLEYIFPAYTGLEPLVVSNTSGEAHGPPGTLVRVRARSAATIDGAAVVAYGKPGVGTEVEDGRIVRGSFTIQADPGTWRLDLLTGETTQSSRDFPISPEPDLAPDVIVDAPRRLEVAVDQPLGIPWSVRDDYGLTRVALLIDGAEVRGLRELTKTPPDAEGVLKISPAELGMSPGMTVELQVAAWDNNGWAQPQMGVNEPPVTLVVKRADDLAMLGPAERLQLRDLMVDLLAEQLMQPWPPGGSSAAVARSGETFDGFYGPLDQFLEDTPAVYRDAMVRRMVRRAREAGHDFVAYTQVNFDPRLNDGRPSDDLFAQAGALRGRAIDENEYVIIWLDRYIQMRALGLVLKESEVLSGLGKRLERELERKASDAEIAGAVDRVRRSLSQLDESLQYMDQGGLRTMVEGRSKEIGLMADNLAEAQAAGRTDDAQELGRRLSEQLQELQADLEYRMKQLDDEEDSLGEEIKSVVEELKRLEREQRQLQSQVRQARESSDAQGTAQAERLWAQVEKLASEAEERGSRLEERLDRAGSRFMTRKQVAEANRSTGRLAESAAARDLRKAQNDVGDALRGWMRVARTVPEAERRAISRRIEQAERILDQLDREASTVDPQAAAQARAMQSAQQELEQELQAAKDMAGQLAAKMPIEPRGMDEGLDQADQSMGDASGDLEAGRPMPAEGAQGQAAEGLKEARESLEEAAAQMAASGGGARRGEQPQEGDDGESDGEDAMDLEDGGSWSAGELTLEQEFDLDAFQRDVLRGSQGDVPEAYRAMKKRYYEELMTQ